MSLINAGLTDIPGISSERGYSFLLIWQNSFSLSNVFYNNYLPEK
jgi:hypothetical protein